MLIELDDAITLGIVDCIGKYARPAWPFGRSTQIFGEIVAVENIVAEHQRAATGADEILSDQEGLGDSFGLGLGRVFKVNSKAAAIAQQVLKSRQVIGS